MEEKAMFRAVIILLSVVFPAMTVDHSKFKTCDQSSFCRRNRGMQKGMSGYEVIQDSLEVTDDAVRAMLINTKNQVEFILEITALDKNSLHLVINEKNPLHPRYVVRDALFEDLKTIKGFHLESKNTEKAVVEMGNFHPASKIELKFKPFTLDLYSGGDLVISTNSRGLFNIEHLREKKNPAPAVDDAPADSEESNKMDSDHPGQPDEDDVPGMWEEHFQSHFDSKVRGPESISCDFSFIGAEEVYGIPEHADNFALKETKSSDPYRLYNLDVFEYESWSKMALYGSIPFVVAVGEKRSVGLLWLNGAETWIDVQKGPETAVMSSIVNLMSGSNRRSPQVDTHWISESGVIDVYFLLGPGPKDVMSQYGALSGNTPLPPHFALGFHHSRWNYNDENDVKSVDSRMDEVNFPYDFLWLDIEHTDGKKYFTWDAVKFPHPKDMIENLVSKGRKMVTIIDPHIKKDNGYFVHADAQANDLYVKNKDGNEYDGWCWPGSSGYLDFFNPKVQEYWSQQFTLDKYQGSTLDLYTWNDMNEPSVFNGPEITMTKDAKHFGGWEHRDVHNIYGFLHVKSSFDGHLLRSGGKRRPFILTRAFFVGSQRYAAVWTGDNTANWDQLKLTIPMCLSLSISGIGFCGADVGGFFQNPDEELLIRWYQAGAFQPFFRVHSHIETARREPYLYGDETRGLLKKAVMQRYTFMPYWYTLFAEYEHTGVPPMRPLWMEFTADGNTLKMDDQFMLGSALLIAPVLDSRASTIDIYFPGTDAEVWYDIDTFKKFAKPGFELLGVTMASIPVYQRGGTIVPRKMRARRATSLMLNDPITLFVALDKGMRANGTLYMDEGDGYEYRNGKYALIEFSYQNGVLNGRNANPSGGFESKTWLERVVILGMKAAPKSASIVVGKIEEALHFSYDIASESLTVRKPGILMTTSNWNLIIG
ncbi:unnamed protein product [Notodromas monacha]|uniref:Glucosidase II subunit alpha n=1 Tax=Notodromas monacha TaxID=399045 RepID=A0A7R9BJ30_9CRUS|nr:unnamed protein product [Notodromas monacha]CAG0915050.1 unnamed protein product [Notodromas monacha]